VRPATGLCAAFVAATIVAASAAPNRNAFTVGVLRRDGLIVPFATWDGKRWRDEWPKPEQDPNVPISLASIPDDWWGHAAPAETWHVWAGGASAPAAVHVRQPDWYAAQCLRQIGLRTDYRAAAPPPPDVQPYPKDGLAVSSTVPVLPIDTAPAGEPSEVMVEAFDEAESKLVDEGPWRLPPAIPRGDAGRARVPVTVEAEYVFADVDGTRYYYIEMSRTYVEPGFVARCGNISFGSGWFVHRRGHDLEPLGFDVSIGECDRYGFAYMLPLGVMRLRDRVYWIAQWSGWDYERYAIVELTPDKAKPVLSVYGGSC
jgi:hypothetical protein